MNTRFPRLKSALYGVPLAILEERIEAIVDVIERRAEGIFLSSDEIAGIKGARPYNGVLNLHDIAAVNAGNLEPMAKSDGGSSPVGVIAVINVMGIIAQHAHQVDDVSGPGGTSTERVTKSFRMALADPKVTGIIFNVDSPGGSVSGVQALADEIFSARGRKPIVAQVNSMMASAAYWIGAAADEIVMTPGAQAGSIGVYLMHRDMTKKADIEGVKVTFIKAGKFKTEGNPFEALGEEAAAGFQATVDSYYSDFVKSVAKYRGVSVSSVRNGYGEGRVLKDSEAVEAGMADAIATLDETVRKMAQKPSSASSKSKSRASVSSEGVVAFTTFAAEDGSALFAQSDWPEKMTLPMGNEGSSGMIKVEEDDTVSFDLTNATARYKILGEDARAGVLVLEKLSGTVSAPAPAATNERTERDAWRRRRHAHRSRA